METSETNPMVKHEPKQQVKQEATSTGSEDGNNLLKTVETTEQMEENNEQNTDNVDSSQNED